MLKTIVRNALRDIPALVLRETDQPIDELLGAALGRSADVIIAEAGIASVAEVRQRLLASSVTDRLLLFSDHCRKADVLVVSVSIRSLGTISQGELHAEVLRLLRSDSG